MSSIGLPPTCRVVPLTQSVCRVLSLPQGGWKVLVLDLIVLNRNVALGNSRAFNR
jgi:hypothetical protein